MFFCFVYMKILAVGDPHGKVPSNLPKSVDAVIVTGDIGKADLARKIAFENKKRAKEGLPKLEKTAAQAKAIHSEIHNSTLKVLRTLSRLAPVYLIQGNVGIPTCSQVAEDKRKYGLKLPATRDAVDKMSNIHLVKNRLRNFNGLRVGFLEYFIDTSWIREFRPPEYQKAMVKAKKETDKARRILDRFGGNLDVLVCHQPPYGILDKVDFPGVPPGWKGKHAGSKAVLDYVRKYQPKYVLCGHIHEGHGMKKIGQTEVHNLGSARFKLIEL